MISSTLKANAGLCNSSPNQCCSIFHTVQGDGNIQNDNRCSVCLEQFRTGDEVAWSRRVCDCPHVFHLQCIKDCFKARRYDCPLCRRSFRPRIIDSTSSSITPDMLKTLKHRSEVRFCVKHGLTSPPKRRKTMVSFSD
jgi:hypothetical protein